MVNADWENHHIEGYAYAAKARGIDPYISVGLITKSVTLAQGGELWQGGCIDGVSLKDSGFDFVLSLYPWEKYVLDETTERVEIEAYDSPDQEPAVFLEAAAEVSRRLLQGQKVLVHCQAGLNRSGVVSTLALHNLGYTIKEALEVLREARSPLVVCNQSFEDWLYAYGDSDILTDKETNND